MDKYRIVEYHHKYYVEELSRFLWWRYYVPITVSLISEYSIIPQYTGTTYTPGAIMYHDTLEDARNYVDGCIKKYHPIRLM